MAGDDTPIPLGEIEVEMASRGEWGPLVLRYHSRLVATAMLCVPCRGMAEDVVQRAWLVAMDRWDGTKASSSASPVFYFVRRCLYNIAREERRSEVRERQKAVRLGVEPFAKSYSDSGGSGTDLGRIYRLVDREMGGQCVWLLESTARMMADNDQIHWTALEKDLKDLAEAKSYFELATTDDQPTLVVASSALGEATGRLEKLQNEWRFNRDYELSIVCKAPNRDQGEVLEAQLRTALRSNRFAPKRPTVTHERGTFRVDVLGIGQWSHPKIRRTVFPKIAGLVQEAFAQ